MNRWYLRGAAPAIGVVALLSGALLTGLNAQPAAAAVTPNSSVFDTVAVAEDTATKQTTVTITFSGTVPAEQNNGFTAQLDMPAALFAQAIHATVHGETGEAIGSTTATANGRTLLVTFESGTAGQTFAGTATAFVTGTGTDAVGTTLTFAEPGAEHTDTLAIIDTGLPSSVTSYSDARWSRADLGTTEAAGAMELRAETRWAPTGAQSLTLRPAHVRAVFAGWSASPSPQQRATLDCSTVQVRSYTSDTHLPAWEDFEAAPQAAPLPLASITCDEKKLEVSFMDTIPGTFGVVTVKSTLMDIDPNTAIPYSVLGRWQFGPSSYYYQPDNKSLARNWTTPEQPTLMPSTECGVPGTIALPETPGVVYERTVEGTKASVAATPAPGYLFDATTTETHWTYEISAADCPETTVPPLTTEVPGTPDVPDGGETPDGAEPPDASKRPDLAEDPEVSEILVADKEPSGRPGVTPASATPGSLAETGSGARVPWEVLGALIAMGVGAAAVGRAMTRRGGDLT